MAVEEGSQRRLLTSLCVRHLLVLTSIMTLLLLTMTLLMMPTTPTIWVGREHCADAVDNRKRQRQLSGNDSVDSTGISASGTRTKFVVKNDHLCDAVVDDDGMTSLPQYIIIVHSRRGQRGRMQRDAIRVTWGAPLYRRVAKPDIRLAFVLGIDKECVDVASCAFSRSETAAVRRESRLYRDLVVADFIDTYDNLSLKSLSGMLWARLHCPAARYVVKVDDDVYMRPELMSSVHHLVSNPSNYLTIVGSLNVNSTVQRRGLWRVDYRDFSPSVFPPYCSGNLYAMTSSVADRLLSVAASRSGSRTSAPFPLEDVYVSALLATYAGVQCVDDAAFPRWDVGPTTDNVDRLRNGSLLAVHNVHYTQMYDVQRRLMQQHV